MLYQGLLSRVISSKHPADLWKRDVGFINHHQPVALIIIGVRGKAMSEVIKQAKRTFTFFSAIKVSCIVFYAGAVARFFNHF